MLPFAHCGMCDQVWMGGARKKEMVLSTAIPTDTAFLSLTGRPLCSFIPWALHPGLPPPGSLEAKASAKRGATRGEGGMRNTPSAISENWNLPSQPSWK